MRYLGTVARVRGQWQATFPDAPGCLPSADAEDALPGKAKEAIEAWLTTFLVQGGTPPRIKRHVGPGLAVEVSPRLAFAVELRRARTEAGLTLPQLAEKAGVSPKEIQQLESPASVPVIGEVAKIAAALGMRPVIDLDRPTEAVGLSRNTRWKK
jgi:DNA-binding XRE family transcriptional regulator/predicted RNase H-like HicB family nuclease